MDYWLGKDRVKGTVLVMGTTGKKVRFNALSPAGGDVIADMACDGTNFAYVDKQNNCQLAGPCDRQSIGSLLRLKLEPEDFIHLALGTVPVPPFDKGTVTWDGASGHEAHPDRTVGYADDRRRCPRGPERHRRQQFEERGRQDRMVGRDAQFDAVKDAAEGEHRLPTKTRFKSPQENADLLVEWGDRTVNPTIDDAKFTVQVPPGLPMCGAKKA